MADKELLSALMDGDTVDEALIAELEQDVESQETWKNYHLISDVMRGEAPETVSWDIAGSVAAALDAEPVHSPVVTSPVVTPLIESQPTPTQARRRLPMWLTQVGQVGVAATVSLMVIFGVQQYNGTEPSDSMAKPLPVLETIPYAGSVEPVSLTRESLPQQSDSGAKLTQQRQRINAMLQDYELQLRLSSEQSGVNGLETEPVIE
jgi:sigma-E factor negative regulatory protein RseA